MSAPIWNVVFEEGSDFDLVFVYYNGPCTIIDVTGYGARFAVRNDPEATPLVVASVTGGQITIAGTTGQFSIKIGATTINTLKNLVQSSCKYTFTVWPGASTPSVNPKRLAQGAVKYSRDYGAAA